MTNKVRSEYKVRQLIPADGRFVALFCHDGEYSTEEIVCYGLCECMDIADTSSLSYDNRVTVATHVHRDNNAANV